MSSPSDLATHPELAVIVPTYERGEHVVAVVRDVVEQLGPCDELLVIDQSATVQPTADVVNAYADARLRHRAAPAHGLPTARNLGLALTRAPIVLFVDDDVLLAPGCLQAHREAYVDPVVGGVVGQVHERSVVWNAPSTCNEVDAFARVRTNLEGDRVCEVGSLKGCNMSIRRSALEQVGGFDSGYSGTALLEESDMSERLRRAGWTLRYVPSAELEHLSAPAGGVRVGSERRTALWRFHNTGRFVARHRGVTGVTLALPTYTAIAVRRAAQWRDPVAVPRLMRAWMRGWMGGRGHP